MDNSEIKARFGIVGNDPELLRAIDTAVQIAPIQLSVLIIGESGSGKEVFPQIIHSFSLRKHKPYVAVNCGAIPEGTIDSELFGHEKGAFTGALNERKGYFEEANTGTIFLDEIGELPLATQAKLLRVLERGEYMRVGSSVVKKTDVRIVAATNVDLEKAIRDGRFREDLFYRLNGILIRIPPLRKRMSDDIPALFHKFTCDFADRNHMPPIRLTDGAAEVLKNYTWPGNVRQLKNVAEQVTVLAQDRTVSEQTMRSFIPQNQVTTSHLPQVDGAHNQAFSSDREILYKILFDMRNDVNDLKKLVLGLLNNASAPLSPDNVKLAHRLFQSNIDPTDTQQSMAPNGTEATETNINAFEGNLVHSYRRPDERTPHTDFGSQAEVVVPIQPDATSHNMGAINAVDTEAEEQHNFSLADNEKETIKRALAKFNNNKRRAAKELQISERTLYRKIHDYGIDDK